MAPPPWTPGAKAAVLRLLASSKGNNTTRTPRLSRGRIGSATINRKGLQCWEKAVLATPRRRPINAQIERDVLFIVLEMVTSDGPACVMANAAHSYNAVWAAVVAAKAQPLCLTR